jgi:hypothetical protein
MLTWKTVKLVAADLGGNTYTAFHDDEDDLWVVDIDGPASGDVRDSLEEAKEYCENTAVALQAEE